ncbi:MAG: dihydropteroate synthase [Desulfobacteraceae bacterium]|nr:dihydropteroate synthase [Desulfobacteraceae bacterium]
MIIVADNLHVINPCIAKAMAQMDAAPIRQMVQRCQKAGAGAIDVCSGPLKKSPRENFSFLVKTVESVTSLPLLLDTTNADALEAGLQVCTNKAIINGFSLEPAKLETILPLAVTYRTDIIGYLLDANSQVSVDAQEMMATAVDLFKACANAGLPPQQLIIDPIITPLSWEHGMRHNREVLSVLKQLTDLLGFPVRTIAGLSNLTSGSYKVSSKIKVAQTFLPMLAAAGLDMVLINMDHTDVIQTAWMCKDLLDFETFSWAQVNC